MTKRIAFFLGSNTQNGFVSLFHELQRPRAGEQFFLLKGGPGCGKSTLMKGIGAMYAKQGCRVQFMPCSSDPQSLDAICVPEKHFCIVDGTSPHTLDPICPGAYETLVPLGDAWEQDALHAHLCDIAALNREIAARHAAATRYIAAACALIEAVRGTLQASIHAHKVAAWVQQIAARFDAAPKGQIQRRLLSAVSVGRVEFFPDTLRALCSKIYALDDPLCTLSPAVLPALLRAAQAAGIACIACPCAAMGGDAIDHLIFPDLSLGITTCNPFHSLPPGPTVEVVSGLQTQDSRGDGWQRQREDLRTAQALIQTAGDQVREAKLLHDDLEQFYTQSTDFRIVDGMRLQILDRIQANRRE